MVDLKALTYQGKYPVKSFFEHFLLLIFQY